MNNFKESLKLFFKIPFVNKSVMILSITFTVLGLALFAMSAFLGELQGDEEYFLSISSVTMGMCMAAVGNQFISIAQNNRYFYSCPQAECIITKVTPIYQAVYSIILTAVNLILSSVAMNIGLIDGNHISDLLLCCAYSAVLMQLSATLRGARGIALSTWLTALPFFVISITSDYSGTSQFLKNIYTDGFGLPLYASVLIFVSAMAVSLVISLVLAKNSYKNRTTKTMVAASQLAGGGL